MKNKTNLFPFKKAAFPFLAAIALLIFTISCSSSDTNGPASSNSFNQLKAKALTSLTQYFHFNTADGYGTFTSAKGVTINLAASSLTLNGNPVTGTVDIEYVEIFDGGNMAATGKHTMGTMPNGSHSMLVSGGEFYINVTKNGQQLDLDGAITLEIPSTLTDGNNGGNPDMTLWNLALNDTAAWINVNDINPTGINGVDLVPGQEISGESNMIYNALVSNFGWTNVDCFSEDPRPKITILATVPEGYGLTNSAIYLHYDGKGNALARLDKFNTVTHEFSEHYGQIPIGLECHIIFVTESNGNWRYAIKQATITDDAVYNFTLGETTTGTQAQLTAAINALP